MSTAPTIDPASTTVLIVDDSEGTRFVFANWLRREGFTVHEAATGAEAIELLARFRFDLALLDVHLPDMSGFELCTHIKSGRATASIPVLHVSATATSPRDRSDGLNRGADGYLIEPVERDELLSTVTALLRYHEARRTSERLAARLEQLHQTTLLINAASTMAELIAFAATGATAIFGVPAIVLAARDGHGWVAHTAPNVLEPSIVSCLPATVLAIAASTGNEGTLDLTPIAGIVGTDSGASGTRITTPRGELVGAVVLIESEARIEDWLIRDHFSQALAVAIENQRIYDVEHQIALTLQHAMLPQSLPRPEALEIAARYQAASDTVEIGGDFYEVLELTEHETLFAIGDVVGHSLLAATVMAELRYSLRAFAMVGLGPAEIIERLGAILLASHPDLSATLCIAVVDRAKGEMRITNAGHVPPIVRSSGGAVEFVEDHGPMLGLIAKTATPSVTVPFTPGALLVLVTDGLLERRREAIDVGLGRLADVVADYVGDAESLCDALLENVGPGDGATDDIAIVVARSVDPRGLR